MPGLTRIGVWLAEHHAAEMSVVDLGDNSSVEFTNGRHRFAWVRESAEGRVA